MTPICQRRRLTHRLAEEIVICIPPQERIKTQICNDLFYSGLELAVNKYLLSSRQPVWRTRNLQFQPNSKSNKNSTVVLYIWCQSFFPAFNHLKVVTSILVFSCVQCNITFYGQILYNIYKKKICLSYLNQHLVFGILFSALYYLSYII